MYVEGRHEWLAGRESRALGDHWELDPQGFCGDCVGYPQPCVAQGAPLKGPAGLRRCLPGRGNRAPFPPSMVHEQLSVQLLVAPGGLHRVQQLLGLDELWIPFSVLGPGHQAPDVRPLPLDLRVHRGCRDSGGWGWSEQDPPSPPPPWGTAEGFRC